LKSILIFVVISNVLIAQTKSRKISTPKNIEIKTKLVARPDNIAPYIISAEGDTINVTDDFNLKQGTWLIKTDAKFGDDPLTQYGLYKDNWKTGEWRTYAGADLVSIENFKNDLLYGECKYFEDGYLSNKGYYDGANYRNIYDTIFITNEQTTEIKKYIVRNNGVSEKDSLWTFYYPRSKKINALRYYHQGEMVLEKMVDIANEDSATIANYEKLLPHNANKNNVPFGSNKHINTSRQMPVDNRKNRERIR
jgi:hypothetical protein